MLAARCLQCCQPMQQHNSRMLAIRTCPKNGVRCARRAPRNPFQKGSSFVFHIHTVTIQKNKTQKAAGQLAAWQPRMKTYSCGAAIAALQLAPLQPRQTTSCARIFCSRLCGVNACIAPRSAVFKQSFRPARPLAHTSNRRRWCQQRDD